MIYFEYNDTRYLYERNIQGDIIKIYQEDNLTLVAEYHYDAYGNHEVVNHNEENIGEKNHSVIEDITLIETVDDIIVIPDTMLHRLGDLLAQTV